MSSINFIKYNDEIRIDRALAFLLRARYENFLPLKLSLYIPIFECLFTTDRYKVMKKLMK